MTSVVRIDPQVDVDIRQLVTRYVWALDTGDIPALMRLFTPDCVVRDTSGARHEGRAASEAYFMTLSRSPQFRGRRHHIDNLLYLECGDACRIRAFWTVEKWEKATGRKAIEVSGHSLDTFVRGPDGAWLFAERLLFYWNDTDGPWAQ